MEKIYSAKRHLQTARMRAKPIPISFSPAHLMQICVLFFSLLLICQWSTDDNTADVRIVVYCCHSCTILLLRSLFESTYSSQLRLACQRFHFVHKRVHFLRIEFTIPSTVVLEMRSNNQTIGTSEFANVIDCHTRTDEDRQFGMTLDSCKTFQHASMTTHSCCQNSLNVDIMTLWILAAAATMLYK